MKVKTLTYADYLPKEMVNNKTTVVIDVFRATSVITTAIMNGINSIFVAQSAKEARIMYEDFDSDQYILGGEENMHKISGFHYGNSPLSYSYENISGKILIFTTTNGTNALNFCQNALETYICSMLNCSYVASKLSIIETDLVIICSGLRNDFAMEDVVCAGMLIFHLGKKINLELDDLSRCALIMYQELREKDNKLITGSVGFNKLLQHGFLEDISFCLQENIYPVTPICVYNHIFNLK